MRRIIVSCLAIILPAFLPGIAWTAGVAQPAILVAAGESLTIPAPGVTRADTSASDVATALAGSDQVTVHGVQPGEAVLFLVTHDSIEARSIQVLPASSGAISDALAGCPGAGIESISARSRIALTARDLEANWTPSDWNVVWTPPSARVWASSALVTPLQQIGIPITPGLQVDWENRWELLASGAFGLIGYRLPVGTGRLMLGGSTLGPAGEIEASVNGVSFSGAAMLTPTGQVVSGARTSLSIGGVAFGYMSGPGGGSPTLAFHSGPVTFSAAAPQAQGGQVGVNLSLGGGVTVTGSWMGQGGWSAGLALPFGAGSVPGTAASAGSVSDASREAVVIGGATCDGPQFADPAASAGP
jgi:hypothetical protein